MKLAFTSCADPLDAPQQPVWAMLAGKRPDHLLLLGDQIYMDYGAGLNPGNGKPAGFDDLEFAAHMHHRYQSQWAAMQGSGLWQLPGLQVHGVWDDHDFAWNNSYGGAGPVDGHEDYDTHELPVPPRKQQISRHLFRQFFRHLRAPVYPVNELTSAAAIDRLAEDLRQPVFHSEALPAGACEGRVTLAPGVNLLLTDGRSFRSSRELPHAQRTLLGRAQMDWLRNNIDDHAVSLIASGCTLDRNGELTNPECWSHYPDHDELKAFLALRPAARVLLLSGDVHNTGLRDDHGPNLIEVVASGAARPMGNVILHDRGNHAVLEFGASTIRVGRHEGEPPVHTWNSESVIDRASWRLLS
jgi:alkaline phosphatase D